MDKKEIVEEKKEIIDDKKEIVEEKKSKKNKKEYIGDLRGFKTYEDAVNYPETEAFAKLDKGCKEEYKNWLKSIM